VRRGVQIEVNDFVFATVRATPRAVTIDSQTTLDSYVFRSLQIVQLRREVPIIVFEYFVKLWTRKHITENTLKMTIVHVGASTQSRWLIVTHSVDEVVKRPLNPLNL
jgi:hypothetical protein